MSRFVARPPPEESPGKCDFRRARAPLIIFSFFPRFPLFVARRALPFFSLFFSRSAVGSGGGKNGGSAGNARILRGDLHVFQENDGWFMVSLLLGFGRMIFERGGRLCKIWFLLRRFLEFWKMSASWVVFFLYGLVVVQGSSLNLNLKIVIETFSSGFLFYEKRYCIIYAGWTRSSGKRMRNFEMIQFSFFDYNWKVKY